jgi:hypothetical protein
MSGGAIERQIMGLKAGGPDDPDGSRTVMVLDAYFRAEQMKTFRRLLWPRLAGLSLLWMVLVFAASLSRNALVVGLCAFGALIAGSAMLEWRAGRKLARVLGSITASLADSRSRP